MEDSLRENQLFQCQNQTRCFYATTWRESLTYKFQSNKFKQKSTQRVVHNLYLLRHYCSPERISPKIYQRIYQNLKNQEQKKICPPFKEFYFLYCTTKILPLVIVWSKVNALTFQNIFLLAFSCKTEIDIASAVAIQKVWAPWSQHLPCTSISGNLSGTVTIRQTQNIMNNITRSFFISSYGIATTWSERSWRLGPC